MALNKAEPKAKCRALKHYRQLPTSSAAFKKPLPITKQAWDADDKETKAWMCQVGDESCHWDSSHLDGFLALTPPRRMTCRSRFELLKPHGLTRKPTIIKRRSLILVPENFVRPCEDLYAHYNLSVVNFMPFCNSMAGMLRPFGQVECLVNKPSLLHLQPALLNSSLLSCLLVSFFIL
ncbi:hypothetical protein VTO42DRAFT_6160 [Malbranchea cinnamomea]